MPRLPCGEAEIGTQANAYTPPPAPRIALPGGTRRMLWDSLPDSGTPCAPYRTLRNWASLFWPAARGTDRRSRKLTSEQTESVALGSQC